jgi:hypothetical protein
VRSLVHRALPIDTFESWKNSLGRVIREEVKKGELSSVTDFVRDGAVELLSRTDSEMEKKLSTVCQVSDKPLLVFWF